MSCPKDTAPEADVTGSFAQLADLIGLEPADTVSVCWSDGRFRHRHVTVAAAPTAAAEVADTADVWFSINPLDPPPSGRGGVEDVTRCSAFAIDLDLKAGGAESGAAAEAITHALTEALGEYPVAVVSSGHGWHVYWTLDAEDPAWTLDTAARRTAAQAIYRRFHRLAAHIAEQHGSRLDNISDLARILRVPGTFNRKDAAAPVPVELHTEHPFGGGGPITFKGLAEALDAHGVPEITEDRQHPGGTVGTATVSDAAAWEFVAETSAYVAAMLDGWRIDSPRDGMNRHSWLVAQAVRLAAAHRLGRITEDDHDKAVAVLNNRFIELLATGERRKPTPGEVAGALAWGIAQVSRMDDDRAADEVGGVEDDDSGADTSTVTTHLPDAFWSSRASLAQIRQLAWSRLVSPDAVLVSALATLSAAMPTTTHVDTGQLTSVPLHVFAAVVGHSGTGKSTAMRIGQDAITIDGGVDSDREPFPYVWPLGSGQGVVEAFIENVSVEVPGRATKAGKPGAPRTATVRKQVRWNVLLYTDEGNDLVRACTDQRSGSTVGEVIRSAWSGQLIGQGNAKAENRRILQPGSYTLGMLTGMQESVVADFVTEGELSKGTPQRFLFARATDPAMPSEEIEDPGPLSVTTPTGCLTVCEEIRESMRLERLDRATGRVVDAPIESHRPALLLHVAGLLAVIEGRTEITVEDWTLAEALADNSRAIVDEVLAAKRRRAATRTKVERAKILADAIEDDDARQTPEGRAAARIRRRLIDAHENGDGAMKWSGADGLRIAMFKGAERATGDAALDLLCAPGSGSGVTRRKDGKTYYLRWSP